MSTITKYVDPQGLGITTPWWADADGTRYLVHALTAEQRAALGITTAVEQVPAPPPPSLAAQADLLAAAIRQEAGAIRRAVLGDFATEYEETARQAEEYKDAGYPSPGFVPEYVDAWAAASKRTPRQAADNILAQAAAWRAAEAAIRRARLTHSEAAKTATTLAALDTVRASWATSIGAIRAALGL